MKRTAILAIGLVLAACSPPSPTPSTGAPASAAPASESAQKPAFGVMPTLPATALVLRGDGISLGRGERIKFDSPATIMVAKIGAAFGEAPSNVQSLSDCGAGALDIAGWDNGFTAYIQDNAFVGWTSIDQRTAEGIGFGSTRTALDAAYHPEIAESSLGIEFSTHGLSGILESEAPDAAIAEFWAGTTCVMR